MKAINIIVTGLAISVIILTAANIQCNRKIKILDTKVQILMQLADSLSEIAMKAKEKVNAKVQKELDAEAKAKAKADAKAEKDKKKVAEKEAQKAKKLAETTPVEETKTDDIQKVVDETIKAVKEIVDPQTKIDVVSELAKEKFVIRKDRI